MRAFLALSVLAFCSACGGATVIDVAPQADTAHGRITGDVGPVEALDDVSTVTVFDDGQYLSIESHVTVGDGVVMTRLMSAFPDMLVPGLDESFDVGTAQVISLVGCVGSQDNGVYDLFDAPAVDLHITVDADRLVTVDAVLRDASTITRTEFSLAVD